MVVEVTELTLLMVQFINPEPLLVVAVAVAELMELLEYKLAATAAPVS
jgi:hypothetical protein